MKKLVGVVTGGAFALVLVSGPAEARCSWNDIRWHNTHYYRHHYWHSWYRWHPYGYYGWYHPHYYYPYHQSYSYSVF